MWRSEICATIMATAPVRCQRSRTKRAPGSIFNWKCFRCLRRGGLYALRGHAEPTRSVTSAGTPRGVPYSLSATLPQVRGVGRGRHGAYPTGEHVAAKEAGLSTPARAAHRKGAAPPLLLGCARDPDH